MEPDQAGPKRAVWSGFIGFASIMKSSLKCTWKYVADVKQVSKADAISGHGWWLGPFLGGSKFWISLFFGFWRKIIFFFFFFFGGGGGGGWGGGVWKNCGHFWGHHKTGLFWGSFLCFYIFCFLKVKIQVGNSFWGLLKFKKKKKKKKKNGGYPIFLIFLELNSRCWVHA